MSAHLLKQEEVDSLYDCLKGVTDAMDEIGVEYSLIAGR